MKKRSTNFASERNSKRNILAKMSRGNIKVSCFMNINGIAQNARK